MKHRYSVLIWPMLILFSIPPPLRPEPPEDVTQLLPSRKQLGSWRPSGDPQTVAGEDLYMLINGGAEIVLEYGFDSAVLHSYEHSSGKSLNLEIYRMTSPAGAYGMYTFRTGLRGEAVDVGNEGFLEGYYLNFWKGNCLVTVIGFDTDDATKQGVMHIGRAVAERIEDAGEKPRLTGLLDTEGLDPRSIKYLRGNLGLYNEYEFDTANVFGLTEGIIGVYGDIRVLLIAYDTDSMRAGWFEKGTERLSRNDRFSRFRRTDDTVHFEDKRGLNVMLVPCRRWILCGIGPDLERVRQRLDQQKTAIENRQERNR